MAIALKVTTDTAKLRRQLEDRFLKRSPRAAVAGINRVARGAFTLSVREIQANVGTSSQKSIRRNLSVRPASATHGEATVTAYSAKKDRIPIYEIRPKPRSVTKRRPAGGVRYGPRNKLIPGSFIAVLESGHTGVFGRFGSKIILTRGKSAGKKGQRIDEYEGPSVALVFSRETILNKVKAYIAERLPQEIARAFKFATG